MRLGLGEADLAAELGVDAVPVRRPWTRYGCRPWWPARRRGIAAPVGPASIDFKDLDALRAGTERPAPAGLPRPDRHPPRAARLHQRGVHAIAGAGGAVPGGWSPPSTRLPRRLGVITGPDGGMVDVAVLRSARDILARAAWQQSRE